MTGCIPCCCSKDLEEQELLDEPTDGPLLCTCRGREYRYHPKEGMGAVSGTRWALAGVVLSCVAIWGATAIGWEEPNTNGLPDPLTRLKWLGATVLVIIGSVGLIASVTSTCLFAGCLFRSNPVMDEIALERRTGCST